MISNYSTLPTALTAENNVNITFDLNGKVLRQSNNVLIQADISRKKRKKKVDGMR